MTTTSYPTLANRLLPQTRLWHDLALALAGSWLVALLSQLLIPIQPVPITGQTFGVLLVGAALGWRKGALALLLYVLQGVAGLPFFAGGASGIARLLGPTGGYLIGFVFAAALTGWLSERGWDRRFLSTLLAMALGNAVIYLLGCRGSLRRLAGSAPWPWACFHSCRETRSRRCWLRSCSQARGRSSKDAKVKRRDYRSIGVSDRGGNNRRQVARITQ